MNTPNWEAARSYVLDRLGTQLPPGLYYHGIHHTRDEVLPAIERLAARANLKDENLLLLRTAVIYHDIGFIEQYTNNEPVAVRIAGETLPGFGYSIQQIEQIQELILATAIANSPKNYLEELIRDADLDSLGRSNFLETSHNLWLELLGHGQHMSIQEWYHVQVDFLSAHQWHTRVAHSLREAAKRQNLEQVKKRLAEMDQNEGIS